MQNNSAKRQRTCAKKPLTFKDRPVRLKRRLLQPKTRVESEVKNKNPQRLRQEAENGDVIVLGASHMPHPKGQEEEDVVEDVVELVEDPLPRSKSEAAAQLYTCRNKNQIIFL